MPTSPFEPTRPGAAVVAAILAAAAAAAAAPAGFEADLVAYLGAFGLFAQPGHVPQRAALPAITYALVGEEPRYRARSAAGLTARTYQLSCFAVDYARATGLEAALRSALHGFRGPMGTTHVSSCRLENTLDLYEPNVDGSDRGTFHRVAEYRIFLEESIPTFP